MARKNKKPAPSPPRPAPASVISQIMTLLSEVSRKFEPQESERKEWMTRHFQNPAIVGHLQDSTLLSLRVLDAVASLEPVNRTRVSQQAGILKGTVSKITRRLIAQKLLTKEALPGNKKEILFRLTPLGKEILLAHRAFDQQMEKSFTQFLESYKPEELRLLARVLGELKDTSFLK